MSLVERKRIFSMFTFVQIHFQVFRYFTKSFFNSLRQPLTSQYFLIQRLILFFFGTVSFLPVLSIRTRKSWFFIQSMWLWPLPSTAAPWKLLSILLALLCRPLLSDVTLTQTSGKSWDTTLVLLKTFIPRIGGPVTCLIEMHFKDVASLMPATAVHQMTSRCQFS